MSNHAQLVANVHGFCLAFLLIYLTLTATSCSLMPDDYDAEYWNTAPGQVCEKPEYTEDYRPLLGCRQGTGVLVHFLWK